MKPIFTDLTDEELSKELKNYAEHRSGEIADLTYAAGLRIAVLSTRVKALEEVKDESEGTCRGTAKASRL